VKIEPVPKSPDRRPIAIVIGLDCITGLQLTRVLHRCGIRVIGIATNPDHFAPRTRCVSEIAIVERNDRALLECLRTLATKDRSVLMPATDTAVAFVAQHGNELSSLFHLANPDLIARSARLHSRPRYLNAVRLGVYGEWGLAERAIDRRRRRVCKVEQRREFISVLRNESDRCIGRGHQDR